MAVPAIGSGPVRFFDRVYEARHRLLNLEITDDGICSIEVLGI